jgi:NhaP-type Na+/H+ or K+/H+ antiporter
MRTLIIHILVSSLTFLILGVVSGFIVRKIMPSLRSQGCDDWNKNHVMEISLLLAGVLYGLISYWISLKFTIESKE